MTLRRLLTARLSLLPGPASRFHLRRHTQCAGPLAMPQTQSSSAALETELRTEFAPRTRPPAPLHFQVSAQVLASGASPLSNRPHHPTSFSPRRSRISQSWSASTACAAPGGFVRGADSGAARVVLAGPASLPLMDVREHWSPSRLVVASRCWFSGREVRLISSCRHIEPVATAGSLGRGDCDLRGCR